MGWLFFLSTVIYTVGFIVAVLLMHFEKTYKPTISDTIVVSNSYHIAILKHSYNYCIDAGCRLFSR
jgi:hypothetical protein